MQKKARNPTLLAIFKSLLTLQNIFLSFLSPHPILNLSPLTTLEPLVLREKMLNLFLEMLIDLIECIDSGKLRILIGHGQDFPINPRLIFHIKYAHYSR